MTDPNIPEEYLDNNFDFGFTFADSDESQEAPPPPPQPTEITVEVPDSMAEQLSNIDAKLASIITMHEDSKPDFSEAVDFARLEEKIDTIVQLEQGELSQMLESQTTNIKAILDEVEERKAEVDKEYCEKLKQVEQMVLPLLYNLLKNPDKEYIYWPKRTEIIQKQIQRILEITKK
tara:strand:- start:382 stop:909 length:528 start_codon:yes stop_codon:yes gene_type:complete